MIVRALIVCVLLGVSGARTQNVTNPDIQVKLSLAEKKTVYRMGERIKLLMEITASRDGYSVDIIPDGTQPGLDTIVVSPETGVTNWINELADNRATPRHAFGYAALTSQRFEIVLNDTLRFDAPDRYSVTISTRRVKREPGPSLTLLSNPVAFEIQGMTEEEEAKEVKRLATLSDSELAAVQLSHLTGDPSTREKVRRLLESRVRSSRGPAFYGLFNASNRSLAVKLLEAALHDPGIPVTTELLFAVTRLKTLVTHGVSEQPAEINWLEVTPTNPREVEIRNAYIVDLAAGLAKRTGQNQTTTALTILAFLPKDSQPGDPGVREVRNIVVQQFDTLPVSTQEWLLSNHWEVLGDPALVPSLKKKVVGSGARNFHCCISFWRPTIR